MPDYIKFPLVLLLVASLAGLALAGLNTLTSPLIDAHQTAKRTEAIRRVLPDAAPAAVEIRKQAVTRGGEETELEYAVGYRSPADRQAGRVYGYAVSGRANGYQSEIVVMVGFDVSGAEPRIIRMTVVSQSETPGLGTKVEAKKSKRNLVGLIMGEEFEDPAAIRPYFQAQFDGLAPDQARLRQDGGEVDGISGATISSRTVCDAVGDARANLELIRAAEGGGS